MSTAKKLSLGAVVEAVIERLLAQGIRATPEAINRVIEKDYMDVLVEHRTRLGEVQIWKMARDYSRGVEEEDERAQLDLPLMGIPRRLIVSSDGVSYVQDRDKATWPELEVGRRFRVENVTRAQVRLDRYEDGLRRVRPVMERDLAMTFGEALAQLDLWKDGGAR